MKIAALALDDREQDGRREIIQSKVDTRRWYSCITSVDLRYVVPIIVSKGWYETGLPIEFRRLDIKQKIKKFFSHVRSDAEKMIFQAAATRGEDPPKLMTFEPPKPRMSVKKDPSKFPQPHAVELELPANFRPRLTAKTEAPFVWAAEAAFQRIQESDIVSKGTAMLTYLAHVRVSNEVRSHTYRTHSIHLQKRAGLKESAVRRSNRELVRIGLLFVHRGIIAGTAGNEVNAYTLGTTYHRGSDVRRSVREASGTLNQSPWVPDNRGKPPSMYTYKEGTSKTSNRVSAPLKSSSTRNLENTLLAEIEAICGQQERNENGGLWRNLMRESEDSLRAVKNAIEDWKLIRPDLHSGVKKSRGAWLMHRYKLNLDRIQHSNESLHSGKEGDTDAQQARA